MPSFKEAVNGFIKDKFCQALGVLGDAITLIGNSPIGSQPPINLPNALSGLVCDSAPGRLIAPAPPFTGGQCAQILYQASPEVFNTVSGQWEAFTTISNIRGPVKSMEIESISQFQQKWIVTYTAADGVSTQQQSATNGVSRENARWGPLSRQDGGVDNCGDPAPVYPTPEPSLDVTGDVTYNIDPVTTITAPVTAIFAPIFISLDGSLKMPIDINVGGLEFKGEVTIAPEFTINLRPSGIRLGPGKPDGGGGAGGQTQVPVPEDTDDVEVIVGVLVFSTLNSNENQATGLPSVGGPNFYVPRLGSVQFAIKTRDSIAWTSDQDVKNLECYVPCPAPQGAIAVRVTPVAGVTRTFSAVRGKPLTSF